MNSFFILFLLLSVLGLVVGLIKPSILKINSRKQALAIFGIATLLLFILVGATTKKPTDPIVETPQVKTPTVTETTPKTTAPTAQKIVEAPTKITTTAQSDRSSVLTILKSNASAKWADNYQMVKYEYDNQVEAYDWVTAQTTYTDIMAKAKQKWGNNYQMVKYEYENQVKAFKSL